MYLWYLGGMGAYARASTGPWPCGGANAQREFKLGQRTLEGAAAPLEFLHALVEGRRHVVLRVVVIGA